jgi:aprataxin
MGFHWEPTLKQLHMHVISRDFAGPHMRSSAAWRSFCSDFFRPIAAVQDELASQGFIAIDFAKIAKLRQAPLHCPQCRIQLSNIRVAQQHIARCKAC